LGQSAFFIYPLPRAADNRKQRSRAEMIELTRLNGNPMVLNSDLIKTAEASPDTMLTLINGEKLIVREECSEVVERVLAYRARLLAQVVKRLPALGDLQRATSLASLDLNPQPATRPAPPPRHL
jgi:flagellar protein FlbD